MSGVSKIFITVNNSFVFSKKRAPGFVYKDNKLELLGGNISKNESPFEALVRELEEEELGGILSNKVKKKNLTPKEITIDGNDGKHHFVYKIEILKSEYEKMIHNQEESYGFHLIQKDDILDKNYFKKDLVGFTPKTIGIFKQVKNI